MVLALALPPLIVRSPDMGWAGLQDRLNPRCFATRCKTPQSWSTKSLRLTQGLLRTRWHGCCSSIQMMTHTSPCLRPFALNPHRMSLGEPLRPLAPRNSRPLETGKGAVRLEVEERERKCHILIAERDTRMKELLAYTLRTDGFVVTEARDGADLLDWISELHLHPRHGRLVDLIISDIRMPTLSLQVLTALRWANCAIPVILTTDLGDEQTQDEAKRLASAASFAKPFELDDIRTAALYYTRRSDE